MRVLFWQELFWPYIGGAEVLAANTLLALRERGYEFIVVTSHDYLDLPNEDCYQGIPIYRFPFRTAVAEGNIDQWVEARQQVAKLKRSFAPHLVHTNVLGPSLLFHLRTHEAHPAPLLFTAHNTFQQEVGGRERLLSHIVRTADWVTGVSAAVLSQLHQLVPEIIPRSSVIYNGLHVPPEAPAPLPTDTPRLLCLGRAVAQKGFDGALTALAAIVDRFPEVRLTIAGDGPVRPELERQAARLGLTDVVDFVGIVAPGKVSALINAATVVVMPSRWEGLPLVALEAGLMARPVIATRVGGLPEVVVPQQTGLLVEKEDIAGLAEALAFVLAHPEAAVQMGQAARRRVQEVFSFERCVNDYDGLYRKLGKEIPYARSAYPGVKDQDTVV